MNNKIILPMELINKILIMRPTHPTAKLLKHSMNEYINIYEDEINYISFNVYLNEGGLTTDEDMSYLFNLYIENDIKLKYNRVNERRICAHCGLHLWEKSFYYHNPISQFVNCENCFETN